MSGSRQLYLDEAAGERRGVVTLDDLPERLLLDRGDPLDAIGPGARAVGRVRRIERGLGMAFVELGSGQDGVLQLSGSTQGLAEGGAIEVAVAAAARRGKGPVLQWIGVSEGTPRLLTPAPALLDRLQAAAPGVEIVRGRDAAEAADEAEAAALAIEHTLPGGGRLTLEVTRALIAIDVDVGTAGGGDARRSLGKVNRQALATAARLLRLKGLGGLVVIDLAGGGHDAPAMAAAAQAAFAADMPGVVIGRISRFGLLELTRPWRERPVLEVLSDAGRPTVQTLAFRLARDIERAAGPGRRVAARCAPEVAAAFAPIAPALVARIGPRFDIIPEPGREAEAMEAYAL